jgi:hypothetical protein
MAASTSGTRNAKRWKTAAKLGAAAVLSLALLGACTHVAMMLRGGVEPPAASEFGFGPRRSSGGLYEATLEPAEPLRVRRMHTVKLSVRTAEQAPVESASIAVDGGMPQHGHGLPTRPKVTQRLGDGTYQVEGVKFNMGGWWELKFRIDSAAGTDSVTVNLDL